MQENANDTVHLDSMNGPTLAEDMSQVQSPKRKAM